MFAINIKIRGFLPKSSTKEYVFPPFVQTHIVMIKGAGLTCFFCQFAVELNNNNKKWK